MGGMFSQCGGDSSITEKADINFYRHWERFFNDEHEGDVTVTTPMPYNWDHPSAELWAKAKVAFMLSSIRDAISNGSIVADGSEEGDLPTFLFEGDLTKGQITLRCAIQEKAGKPKRKFVLVYQYFTYDT
eukprot:PhF_6_TR23939/c0_g1_i3/m.33498